MWSEGEIVQWMSSWKLPPMNLRFEKSAAAIKERVSENKRVMIEENSENWRAIPLEFNHEMKSGMKMEIQFMDEMLRG